MDAAVEEQVSVPRKQSVAKYLAEVAKANGAFTVKGYVRFETGEGLEKKNEDFAAEVAAQLQ